MIAEYGIAFYLMLCVHSGCIIVPEPMSKPVCEREVEDFMKLKDKHSYRMAYCVNTGRLND